MNAIHADGAVISAGTTYARVGCMPSPRCRPRRELRGQRLRGLALH